MLTPLHTDLSITDLLQGDLQLASPPCLYFELKNTIENPSKSLVDAGKIIEKDPGLSARLLKIVNSAFYGFPAQIATISHAITIIGVQELENLVLGTLVIDKFSSLPNGLISMQEFWGNSLRCALIAKEISTYQQDLTESETLFICGLLHEIGLLVFYRRIPALAREVGLLIESTETEEIQAEQKLIGFDHYQTGAELARLWKLPEVIASTIRYHQAPSEAAAYARQARIIKQASVMVKNGRIFDAETFEINRDFAEYSLADLSTISQQASTKFDEIFKLFYPAN